MPTTHASKGSDLKPRWTLERPEAETVAALMRSQSVPELVAQLLVNRGIESATAAREHLVPDLKRLHDPFLLPGMRRATERLRGAIERDEMILVHGDYDVDGVTGTTLLVRLLEQVGARVSWHIPNRFTDGYSFGQHSIRRAREVDARVVISVDNGTSEVQIITELLELGIDTIVTDHHEPPLGDLPPALAIVNPKLHDSEYPFRELCGGAVAFKLAWALCQEISGETRVRTDLRDFLVDAMAYVAVATVCDVVPLVDENRVLAHFGLKALEQTQNPGLKALLHVSGLGSRQLGDRRLGGDDVGFQIGPRINASGRLETAALAVEVLLAQDDVEAGRLARELNELNERRKVLQRELTKEALTEAARFADPTRWPITVVAGQGWHQGVVGIVAARLVETLGRPALVLGLDGERGRGSARSVPGVSVLEIMHGGKEHMLRYGGHAQAAGCEVRADAVDDLREALCASAREIMAESPPPEATLRIDAEIPLQAMTPELMRQVEKLEPFGERNSKPVLLSSDVRLAEPARLVGADRSHVMLQLRQGETVRKAMAFGMGARIDELVMGQPLHVVYTPRWNTFRGKTNLEFTLTDFCVGQRPEL